MCTGDAHEALASSMTSLCIILSYFSLDSKGAGTGRCLWTF